MEWAETPTFASSGVAQAAPIAAATVKGAATRGETRYFPTPARPRAKPNHIVVWTVAKATKNSISGRSGEGRGTLALRFVPDFPDETFVTFDIELDHDVDEGIE